jgi:peptidyl-prolyl cis-trans isomerase B (cyclophilin B)
MAKKTRDRQLAKLAARRAAERKKRRRQRVAATVVGLLVAAGGLGVAAWAFLREPQAAPSATGTPTPTMSPAGPVACGATAPTPAGPAPRRSFPEPPELTIDPERTYTATLETSCGSIEMELTPETAPNAVNSVIFLANQGFYDGLVFHRVVPGFVIQGGDPQGDGTGGPGFQTTDTPPKDASYPKGAVAMAKGSADPPGRAGSQFFIVAADGAQALNQGPPQYALIGMVTAGMDVVATIESLEIQGGAPDGPPVETVYIESFRVNTS